ncbi:hypothetical protein D3C80_1742560 [compost metagenome]
MAPKPMISARPPSVPPTPALMEPITLSTGIPCMIPTARATRINEIKPFSLKRIISSSSMATPMATITSGIIFLQPFYHLASLRNGSERRCFVLLYDLILVV